MSDDWRVVWGNTERHFESFGEALRFLFSDYYIYEDFGDSIRFVSPGGNHLHIDDIKEAVEHYWVGDV